MTQNSRVERRKAPDGREEGIVLSSSTSFLLFEEKTSRQPRRGRKRARRGLDTTMRRLRPGALPSRRLANVQTSERGVVDVATNILFPKSLAQGRLALMIPCRYIATGQFLNTTDKQVSDVRAHREVLDQVGKRLGIKQVRALMQLITLLFMFNVSLMTY